ncbi:MAG TPA: DUF6620 family protein [Polyangia bacterium]|nr:DUF6620 family protein [Polyangia bacterium]
MDDLEKKLADAEKLREQKGRERDARIQDAMKGPSYHKFSDHDKTPQGQKAIDQGIANVQGGRASYDYTRSAGADLSWPDLDPAQIGELEPWLCYPGEGEGGWIDLNATASGRERRAKAAYKTLGVPKHEALQRVDDVTTRLIDSMVAASDAELNAMAAQYQLKKNNLYSYRDYALGLRLEFDDLKRRADKKAQQALDAANEIQKEEMGANIAAAKSGGLLDPIQGISMEDWAGANAKIASGNDLASVLKVLGVEKPVWDAVSAEWMGRMSRDTTFAITTVYGNAFVNPNIGRFAAGGAAKPAAPAGGALEKVMGDFELYIKIMSHQNAGAAQGKDAITILKKYGLTVNDWATIGAHWGGKMMTDFTLATRMPELMQRYGAEFAKPGAGDDIDF